jgi:hypothetical protein
LQVAIRNIVEIDINADADAKIRFLKSLPSTWRKQLVVCPIPLGNILSLNMALMTVDFPLLVLPKKATFI